ncbi:MAG TPA: hypothetical protein PK358_09010 [Spirochaetota bacterium]|nr:hypothetical protein [Spirochaetota bacterium]
MKKKDKKVIIPDIKEFTDDTGKKWVQTSTDDLFSMRELNDIIRNIEQEREKDEVVLARIDFQKVDREFYEAAIELQKRLQKQTLLMKQYISESKKSIEKKNRKLRELIEYIRKLHQLLSYLNANPDNIDTISITLPGASETEAMTDFISEYDEVEEIVMTETDD